MVADALAALEGLRREFVEEGAVHRQQLDGTRQTLVAVAQLRHDLLALVAPGPAAPPEDGDRGGPVAAGGPPEAGRESPYPGLAGFQPEDAGWFFGREPVVAELLGRLSEQLAGGPLLALVGASGAGKSSDGRTLATVTAADPLVRLWDARTGAPLAQLTGHDSYPNAVALSPDGGLLATGGQDRAAILWPLDPAGAVQRICRVLVTARAAEGLAIPAECR